MDTSIAQEALDRAQSGQSVMNYAAIYEGFAAKGIAADDIHPRVNVLTYHAWRALGRQVRKGEHGVRVVTFVGATKEKDDGTTESFRRPWYSTVFHVSQTDAAK